jgi:hypothetical protein
VVASRRSVVLSCCGDCLEATVTFRHTSQAGASIPVRVTGLSDFPRAGEDLLVVPSEEVAKGVVEGRKRRQEFQVISFRPLYALQTRGLPLNVSLRDLAGVQALLRSESSLREKREEAKQARAEEKEHERRVQLAQYRDRLRRRKVADGLPIPEDLKEQPWERRIAAGEVTVARTMSGCLL